VAEVRSEPREQPYLPTEESPWFGQRIGVGGAAGGGGCGGGGPATVSVIVAELLSLLGSPVVDVAATLFVIVPRSAVRTMIVTVAAAPFASVPSEQPTDGAALHAPWVALIETSVTPGRFAVTPTCSAALGPPLATFTV
jgi:hypothetical protein